MSADETWLDEVGSPDSNGRAIWALGYAAQYSAQAEVRIRALRCLDRALPALDQLSWPRARAFGLLGLSHWRQVEPAPVLDSLEEGFSSSLVDALKRCSTPDWRWFEEQLTYCNARLPEALIASGHRDAGLESLDWLCHVLEVDGRVSLIGNRGWYSRGGERAVFDQQAVDAAALVSACVAAHRLGEQRFRYWAELGFAWFEGRNVGGRSMIDPETGGCYDGLLEDGVNTNQGAESLLAWLLAWSDMAEQGWL